MKQTTVSLIGIPCLQRIWKFFNTKICFSLLPLLLAHNRSCVLQLCYLKLNLAPLPFSCGELPLCGKECFECHDFWRNHCYVVVNGEKWEKSEQQWPVLISTWLYMRQVRLFTPWFPAWNQTEGKSLFLVSKVLLIVVKSQLVTHSELKSFAQNHCWFSVAGPPNKTSFLPTSWDKETQPCFCVFHE